MFFEEQRVLAHHGVRSDPEEDPDPRRALRKGDEEREGRPLHEGRVRDPAREAEGRQADPQPDEEPSAGNPRLNEVGRADEDEDRPERRREGEACEGRVVHEDEGLVEVRGEVLRVNVCEDRVCRQLARKEERGRQDTQEKGVAVLDPPRDIAAKRAVGRDSVEP